MTSIAPRTRSGLGNAQLPTRVLEASPSSTSQPNIIPLGSVSPEMASRLIDELMRVIEEQAEVKLTSTGTVVPAQEEPQEIPPSSDQKSYYEADAQPRDARPTSVVYYSAPQLSFPRRNGAISQPGLDQHPAPLNFSRNRESIATTANIQPPSSPSRRGSKFILVDQTQVHPLHRIGSQETSVYETNSVIPQRFPLRLDSIRQGEKHSPPPSFASRRHSTDANQSYMSLSDTASVHDTPQNSILNYKKWIGASKTGSRVTSQKSTGPVEVVEKPAKEKAPAISKSKSFFSHFKYEMHPTPMYGYVPDKKPVRPASQAKSTKRFSIDGSSSNANSLRKHESVNTKSSSTSTKSKEKIQKSPAQDSSRWPLVPPSRNPPHAPLKQQGSGISQLAWNSDRVPVSNKDFGHVEGWLADTHTEHSSPIYPLSPIFSEKGITSTAATSPVDSNRLSVVFEGRRSAASKERGNKMQSRIISWVDLEGCTPEFVQSLQVLGIVEGVEPALTPVGGDDGSDLILPTPSSKYMEEVFVEFQTRDPEITLVSTSLPATHATASNDFAVRPPPTIRARSTSQSSFKKSKPQPPSPLVIPSSSYSIFPTPPKSLSNKPSQEGIANTTVTRPSSSQRNTFDDGDSPTLPIPMSLPPRSSKRVRRTVGSPPTPSAHGPRERNIVEHDENEETPPIPSLLTHRNSNIVEDETTPPPIPTRLRPITPPKPTPTTNTTSLFLAPPTGLSLTLSRQYISQTKSSWEIVSPPSKQALLTCISYPMTRTLLFSHPATQNQLFNFVRRDSSSWVAMQKVITSTGSIESQVLFRITESIFGRWIITFSTSTSTSTSARTSTNSNIIEDIEEEEEDSEKTKRWEVRVDDLDEGRDMEVFCEKGEEVGRVLAKGRNVYAVKVRPGMDFAVMSCLTTVFDEWRVDEGFF